MAVRWCMSCDAKLRTSTEFEKGLCTFHWEMEADRYWTIGNRAFCNWLHRGIVHGQVTVDKSDPNDCTVELQREAAL